MRNTLIIGLLLCLPTAVLLASASLVVLAGYLCRRNSRSARRISVTQPVLVGQILAVFAQAGPGGQGDELLGLRAVIVDWCHRKDESALAKADHLDQDGAAGPGQDDHVTGVDVAGKDHILHR